MSQLWFDPARGFLPSGDGEAPWATLVDPTLARVRERTRWEARAAQWRARALAEAVFGGEVEARLRGHGAPGAFRGVLELAVPFDGLDEHRERERVFLAWAVRDPILARMPFLYVFGARPRTAGSGPARTSRPEAR